MLFYTSVYSGHISFSEKSWATYSIPKTYTQHRLHSLVHDEIAKFPLDKWGHLRETVQKVEVHFNFIGEVNLPDVEQRRRLIKSFGKEKGKQTA